MKTTVLLYICETVLKKSPSPSSEEIKTKDWISNLNFADKNAYKMLFSTVINFSIVT
jgi:hypothetical protein